MADKEKNVVLNFKMDGQVQYAETLKEINAVMNTAAKEYKNHIAAMGKDGSATEKLAAEKKKLEIQMEGAQKRTKMLREQYEAMSKDTKTTTGQLTQMYGKLLDAEKAETALQKSMDRVNDGLSDQAQEAREAQEVLDDLKEENKLLDAEQKNLNSTFKLQKAELGDNADETEKLELAQKQLKEQMDLSERTVKNLEQQLEATKSVYGDNSIEVMQMEAKLNDARTTISKFNGSLKDIDTASDEAGDGLEELGKKMDLNNLLEATELLEGVTDKLFEVGQAAMDSATGFGDSQTNLRANLGLTGDEAEKLNGVVDQVFRNGIVGSIDEATEAVIIAKQTFKDLNDVDLENITNKVTAIAERTGTDVKENVRGAEQLMNAFGVTGEEALDLIASGYQNGLDRSDDFTDTLTEYAPLFEQAGFGADEMLQIMQNGLENGARNTDLVADAVKELQIRMGDGAFEESLENFSDETENTFNKWKDGEATVADVAQSVQKDIEKMSPVEQQEALSAISTQFEDLGTEASTNLFKIGDAFDDTNGKADEMAKKSPGEKWESSLRELQQSLLPIGQNLIDSLSPVIEILADMGEWFSKLPGPVQTFVTVFGSVLAVATAAIPIILGVAAAITALQIPLLPIIGIIAGVAAAIAGIVLVIQNWGAITDWISEKWTQFTTWLTEGVSTLASNFVSWFTDMKDGAVNKFKEMKEEASQKVTDLKNKASETISSFKTNVVNKATELKDGFVNKVTSLKDGAVNKVTELKNKATSTITSFKDNVVNKASELKNNFVEKVNSLKDGALEKFNNLRTKAGDAMTKAKDLIVAPIEKARDLVKTAVDKITGFFSGIGDKLKIDIPKPKLPRFTIKGKFDMIPPDISVPKIGIDWRAKGGIFTRPTIFGQSGGRYQAAGEAGPEAVLPLNEKTLGDIGRGIAESLNVNKKEKQPLVVQMVTPDKRVLAEMVAEDVYEMNQHELERDREFSRG
ncbi:phage tail tape measure protein [Oceanobacillus kapialis]|uniref:Phage tail tape measure protein n=1 Tax=Oceanobacillus kapialis TaxID=481353 RepID=A0ABW5PZJ4_9BACI